MDAWLDEVRYAERDAAAFAHDAKVELESIKQAIEVPAELPAMHEPALESLKNDPLVTARQQELFWYWEMFGVIGLAYWIKQIARYERAVERSLGIGVPKRKRASSNDPNHDYDDSPSGHSSWSKMITDLEHPETSRCFFYLCSIPPDIISALIRGDLPSRMQEPGFRAKWGQYLKCQRTQGTYIMSVVRVLPRTRGTWTAADESGTSPKPAPCQDGWTDCAVEPPQSSAESSGVRYGFTWIELIRVVDGVKLYIDLENPESEPFARMVDGMIHPVINNLDYVTQREYGGGGEERDRFDVHRQWVKDMKLTYLYWALRLQGTEHEGLLHKPMKRCLSYGGLSFNVQQRTDKHANPGSHGSGLLGLVLAICECSWPGAFDVKDYAYPVIRTVQVSDIGLDEALTCVLTSSNNHDGGFNMTWAGSSRGSRVDREEPSYLEGLHSNAVGIEQSGFQEINIRDSCEKINKNRERFQLMNENNRIRAELEADLARDLQKVEELEANAKRLTAIAELEALESLCSELVLQDHD
ncbi:hypothetical protein PV04_03893 [Phialophora macrospora]|uniref:Uncharacterized protein n=1 Tax=Phialophora macrospora TaxID=1851006 RepID=A0A0D2GHJ5_9EURO|nr:hypothetical protein PV04_03893 [Phialophora macrospora]